jgi:hypothetical protein
MVGAQLSIDCVPLNGFRRIDRKTARLQLFFIEGGETGANSSKASGSCRVA